MYCIKCGKQIEENAKFCEYCGAKTELKKPEEQDNQIKPVSLVKKKEENAPVNMTANMTDEVEDDFVTQGYQIKGNTIMKVASVIALILYLAPAFSFSYSIWDIGNISLFDIVFGYSYAGEKLCGFHFGAALLLLMSVGIVFNAFQKEKERGWGIDAAYGFGGIAFSWFFVYFFGVTNVNSGDSGAGMEATFLFYLFLIVNFIGLWAGCRVEIQKQIRNFAGEKEESQIKKDVFKKAILESIGAGIGLILLFYALNQI